MATIRLTTAAVKDQTENAGISDGLRGSIRGAIYGITTTSRNRVKISYNISSSKDGAVVAEPLQGYINYSIYNSLTGASIYSTNNDKDDVTTDDILDFHPTNVNISMTVYRNFSLANGSPSINFTINFTIKDHPGNMILFVTTPNTHLRMPNCMDNSTKGQLYIIKNNSEKMLTIGPSPEEEYCKIEYLDGVFTNYTVAGTSVLKLTDNQCVGLMNDGVRWHVVMFYNGNGTNGQGRDGGAIREITPTIAVVYGLLDVSHMRVNLPAPTSRQYLMIFGERTTSSAGWQIQLNAPSGGLIDGRWSEVNINITYNRHGNAAIFLISNGSTWYIAALYDMSSMDSYADGIITSAGTVSATTTLAVLTNSTVSDSVWSGRSYNVFSVEPAILGSDTAIFRIFKQYNSTGVGLGLRTSADQQLFPKSYDGSGSQSRTQMFKYDATGLLALFCVQIKFGSEYKILFLNQYPTNF
jgi:hypothetical protein